ncbi:sulfite exporter TauE/SafE family protein [Microbispora sp. CSR-4]|uniref:urease accessory protein UreH domain-containing protein n=1 Tax=Microbispora sp. CSR-4 TaxID=2592813 RepID=UPI00164F27FB|nr:sulfite exporter TauE/SafE family protein [Microbispora sp. CSR-4]
MEPAALFAGGLVAGLAAGTASCTAVQGGLLIGLAAQSRGQSRGRSRGPSRALSHGLARGLPPVAAFLTGRLAAHTALGALLGLLGAAVQVGPRTRAALLVAAGTAVVVLAVRMLRRRRCAQAEPGTADGDPRACSCADGGPAQDRTQMKSAPPDSASPDSAPPDIPPPDSAFPGSAPLDIPPPGSAPPGSAPRCPALTDGAPRGRAPLGGGAGSPGGGARSPGLARAAALGMATIFVPCGVTIGMEVVAVGSGSALGGAATLAGLALGTAPAFAALGLLLRTLVSTRLAALAGIAALAAGLFTAGSGLRLGGWLPDASLPEFGSPAAAAGRALTGTDGVQRLTVWATPEGFRPGIAVAAAGRPVEIVFRTKDNRGCTRTLTIDDHDVVLPVTGERVVRLPARPQGRLRYACGMGMYVGFVRFERSP